MNGEWGIPDMRAKIQTLIGRVDDHELRLNRLGGNHVETATVTFNRKGRATFKFEEPFEREPKVDGAEIVRWIGKYKGVIVSGKPGVTTLVTAS